MQYGRLQAYSDSGASFLYLYIGLRFDTDQECDRWTDRPVDAHVRAVHVLFFNISSDFVHFKHSIGRGALRT